MSLDDLPFDVDPEVRKMLAGRDLDTLRPEDLAPPVAPLSREDAEAAFSSLIARISDGRAAATERAILIARLDREGWSQTDIAATAGISQAAVSKSLKSTPGSRSLEEMRTVPYLTGRLVGLADHLASRHKGMSCERYADKIASGGLPPLQNVIARLQVMLSRDLAKPSVSRAYRDACADIISRLADVAEWPPLPWPLQGQWEFMLAQHHQRKALTDAQGEAERKRAN